MPHTSPPRRNRERKVAPEKSKILRRAGFFFSRKGSGSREASASCETGLGADWIPEAWDSGWTGVGTIISFLHLGQPVFLPANSSLTWKLFPHSGHENAIIMGP